MIKSILSKNIIKSYGNENYTKNHLSSDVSPIKVVCDYSILPALPSHEVGNVYHVERTDTT